MLIVNADDWGYDLATTDAIVAAHSEGRITSATAMVHMQDSERAARLAGASSIPIGLHLNLMERYTATTVREDARARQERVVSRYRTGMLSRWLPSRELFSLTRRCVEEQFDDFAALYGATPTHVDGHQHGHMSTAALWALLRRGVPTIRRSFTFRPSDKSVLNRALRFALNSCLSLRFRSTDRFYSIRDLHPQLGGHGLDKALAEAQHLDVEIMVHPGIRDEYEILMAGEWAQLIADVPRGSYRDLTGNHDR
jgi:predicted glycoside hydrolase/deacetylase ChbG (UPF0249 family)